MKVAPVGNPAHRKRTYVKNRRATVKDEYGRLTLLRIDDAAEGPGETKRSAFVSIREHVGRE